MGKSYDIVGGWRSEEAHVCRESEISHCTIFDVVNAANLKYEYITYIESGPVWS